MNVTVSVFVRIALFQQSMKAAALGWAFAEETMRQSQLDSKSSPPNALRCGQRANAQAMTTNGDGYCLKLRP